MVTETLEVWGRVRVELGPRTNVIMGVRVYGAGLESLLGAQVC